MQARRNQRPEGSCTSPGSTAAAYNTLKACQQSERSIVQVSAKGVSRTGKVLLEGGIVVPELFHSILWWSTSRYCQRIHRKTVSLCLYPLPEVKGFYAHLDKCISRIIYQYYIKIFPIYIIFLDYAEFLKVWLDK